MSNNVVSFSHKYITSDGNYWDDQLKDENIVLVLFDSFRNAINLYISRSIYDHAVEDKDIQNEKVYIDYIYDYILSLDIYHMDDGYLSEYFKIVTHLLIMKSFDYIKLLSNHGKCLRADNSITDKHLFDLLDKGTINKVKVNENKDSCDLILAADIFILKVSITNTEIIFWHLIEIKNQSERKNE